MQTESRSWPGRHRYLLVVVGVALAAIAAEVWLSWSPRENTPAFRTAPVRRGDIVATIGATGTIEPEAAVDVGAQVAGVIVAFGKDKDGKDLTWGSVVDAGTVLAKVDDSLYAAAVKAAQAQIDQYSGQLARDEAVLEKDRVDLLRYQKLAAQNSIALQQAEDQLYVVHQDEGTVKLDMGLVEGAKASLLTAQTNLDYCTIKSPVKGVIIDRRVNIGQTVVSSLSAPSLFLIANDLSHIQAWVSVNEADVGSISRGQPVTFTVDAFAGRVFHGQVGQVRLNATMTQNVVTYTIEVDIDNSDGVLLPYLTANAEFEVGRRKDVLLVPNAALRWSPRPGEIAPGVGQEPYGQRSPPDRGSDTTGVHATVWIAEGKFVRPVPVWAGLTDGAATEVEGPGLVEGLPIVIGVGAREVEATGSTGRNPFAPQPFRRQSQGQGAPEQPAPAAGNGR